MNLFHRSRAFAEKHKRHHHLIIALLVVAVAGAGGVALYKKIAKAATVDFTQTSWAGGASATIASHANNNQNGWTYSSSTPATTVLDGSGHIVLPSTSYAFTDDGATSTVPTAATTGGTFGAGAHSSTAATTTASGASVGLGFGVDGGTDADGEFDLAFPTDQTKGCTKAGMSWSGSTCTVIIGGTALGTYNFSSVNIPSGTTLTTAPFIKMGSFTSNIVFDTSGNLYTVGTGNTVKKVTPSGVISTFATVGAGPKELIFDSSGNLYTANYTANTVSKVTSGGTVTTFATVSGNPTALAIDPSGYLYTANYLGNSVSKIDLSSGTVLNTFTVGNKPYALAFDPSSGNLYTANLYSHSVSKITSGGTVTVAFAAVGSYPQAIVVDASGNVYTASQTANTISKITPGGSVTTFATVGVDPRALAFDTSGNLYTANYIGGTVSKVTPGGTVTTFATLGKGPWRATFDTSGNLYVGNILNGAIKKITSQGVILGDNPLVLKVTGNVSIVGTGAVNLDGSANSTTIGGFGGAAGGDGGVGGYYDGSAGMGTCGGGLGSGVGGGGGGHAATGGTVTGGGTGGCIYNATERGGFGGGGANSGDVDLNGDGGGGGGGYLKIMSSGSVTNSGTISANGGNVINNGYGGGAGSGGRINLIATAISNSGIIRANGGSSANGGGGAGGWVILQDGDGVITGGTITATGGTSTGVGAVNGGTPSPEYTQSTLTYVSPGTFTSAVIDLGAKASFTTLAYTTTLNGQTITMDARAGNTATPDGSWTSWQTGVASGGSISGLAGNRYFQYRANLSTADPAVTPTLDSVTINYNQYGSGNLTSSKYDIGSEAVVSKLTWVGATTSTEWIKFQVRSSADGNTWSYWCGDSTCDASETDYFEDANNGVTITSGHPLRSGTGADADRYFQYKVFLASGGSATPTLTSVTVQYVVNAPPAVGNILPAQITDSGSANYGKVSFSFDTSDSDTTTGSPANQRKVTPTLYEYYNGSSWATICTPSTSPCALSANAFTNIDLTADSATTTTTVVWTPTAGIPLTNGAKIRVTITDGEAANFSATATSGTFSLDSTAPVVASTGGFLVDSSVSGAGLAGIKLAATDDSTMQYRLCNNADFTADGLNSGAGKCAEWTTLAASPIALATSTTSWNTTLTASSTEVVYVQVRDAYGNVTARTATAPATPANFLATDTTNPTDGTYREFLSWGIATSTGFGSYQVYSNTTGVGDAYSPLGSPITNRLTNSYLDTITTATSTAHHYKVVTISANGDVSEFTVAKSDTPDGSGSADITAPVVYGIATSSVGNTSANITFGTYSDASHTEGELATSTVRYASYSGSAPTSCPTASSTASNTYAINHSVYLTGLNSSTNYVFCVFAKNITGLTSTASSVSASGGTFTTIGGPRITGVTEREVTDTSATIFWNTESSSDSKVCYSTTTSGANSCATSVTGAIVTTSGTNANGTFFQHQIGLTGLSSGLTYYYKVVSADAVDPALISTDDNNGQYYSFVTLKDTTPPTITGTSTPVLAPTAAVVVWQTNELATSKVDYGTASGVYSKGVAEDSNLSIYHVSTISSATNNALGSGDNTLVKETPYYYRVTSKDAANNTATATGTFTTPADGNVTITMVNVVNSAGDTTKDTTAPSVSNVKVSDITPFSAVVKFDTSEAAVSFVDYGKDTSYGDSAGDKVYGTTHTVKLRGLSLGTEYHIKVTAHDKAGNTGTGSDQAFKTTFLSENLKDMAKIENIEQFQKEIEDTIESILPSLVPPFVSKPVVTDITENGATVSFRTNIKSFPVVGFVEDALYDATKENPYTGEISDTTEKAVDHTVALVSLKQNTKYRVQARAFSLPKVIGKSADISFTTKAAKIAGSIIDRKKDSFTVVWTTDEPTSSIVEYKNVASGVTERKTDDAMRTSHSMRIENLPSGTTYAVDISGLNEQGNVVEAGASLTVTTSRDVTPPVISGFKVDNALVPGRTDRIQTIVSWKTDEPANSTTYYEEGAGTAGDTKELVNKNEVLDSYVTAHSVILPNLKPGTIYRLKVTSSDDSGNEASFGPRTVITPRQTESITDIIFKNFEDSFKFLRDI